MSVDQHRMEPPRSVGVRRGAPELPVKLVPYHGQVPEPLAGFFQRLTPWDWRDLRTVFCRFPEVRRLVNILRTIDLVFEKAPHTLARGHWSIAGFLKAREDISGAIVRLGHLANQAAADARIRLPALPERQPRPVSGPPKPVPAKGPVRPAGGFQRFPGGIKTPLQNRSRAA